MTSSATCEVRGALCEGLCVPLSCATDPARVGGKAANLARLIALGIAVPDGEVLTVEAFARAHASPVLPDDVAMAVEGLADRWLTHAPLVVRSSAIGEDGATASFAGQFDSILHVRTRDELRRAIRQCWMSYASPRAEFYRRARGINAAGMAVVIQRQVPAVSAGVLFTQAPTGAADEMLIEGCDGLADGLVSGRVEPWSVRAKKPSGGFLGLVNIAASIAEAFGAPQDIEWAIDGDDRVWIVQTRPITSTRAQCDLRPATGAGGATCAPHVLFSNANINENFPEPVSPLLYSIASTGYYHYFRNLGLAFGVSRARLRAMDRPLRSIIAVHGARMYYNLTSIHAVLRMAPYGDALAASFNEFVGADEIAAPLDSDARWHGRRSRIAQAFELARIVAATTWQYARLPRRIKAFEGCADEYASLTRPADLESRSLSDLNRNLVAFLDIRRYRWKNASLADAAAMVCYSLLQRTLAWSGAAPSLHNRLLRALPGVPSSQPPLRLWELSRQIRADVTLTALFAEQDADGILTALNNDARFAGWQREFDRYLADWGFRSSRELMLTSPTLDESPAPAIDLLKQYVLTDGEAPATTMARQARERRAETRGLWRSLIWRAPHKAVAAVTVLRATQTAIAFRERARLKQALLYTRCRHVVRAIGRRFVQTGTIERQDDVFMLRWQEIDELASGRAMFAGGVAALVAARAAEHARLSLWTPPDRIVLPEGDVWTPDAGAGLGSRLELTVGTSIQDATPSDPSGPCLRGTSACGGRVSAPAAVLADVSESHRLAAGDVLVTRQTDPGWAPVFCLVRGLVIERGGMLSHGAIIAREFGLPCVVGIKDATRLIRHGDRLTVDGDAGTCEVAPRETSLDGAGVIGLLRAYARQRIRLEIFAPAIALLSFAALWVAGAEDPNLTVASGALVLMTLLILQFRLWDDLADRDRDRAAHPHRVLVAHDPAPFRGLLIVLLVATGVVGFAIGGGFALISIAVLNSCALVLYRGVRPHLSADLWPALLVATRYPALVALVAAIVGEPVLNRLLLGCLTTSAGACLYEWTHPRPSSAGVTP